MSWHKHQEYDPTAAFIQNNRLQKVLDLKLESIDKVWFSQLKHISKERLDTTLDLNKLETEKQKLKYFDVNMDAQEIREHGEDMSRKLKKIHIEERSDKFNFDLVRERSSLTLAVASLPRITRQKTVVVTKGGSKRHVKKHATHVKKKKPVKLKKTHRVMSVSDSNLHLSTVKDKKDSDTTDCKDSSERDEERKSAKSKQQQANNESFAKVTDKFLPLIRPPGEDKPADYRYLRHRMLSSLALPPVTEVTSRRKHSI